MSSSAFAGVVSKATAPPEIANSTASRTDIQTFIITVTIPTH
ncbi:MAG: hypothetical protein AAFR26_04780 [Cyanobacteria bacterium J06626_4]